MTQCLAEGVSTVHFKGDESPCIIDDGISVCFNAFLSIRAAYTFSWLIVFHAFALSDSLTQTENSRTYTSGAKDNFINLDKREGSNSKVEVKYWLPSFPPKIQGIIDNSGLNNGALICPVSPWYIGLCSRGISPSSIIFRFVRQKNASWTLLDISALLN